MPKICKSKMSKAARQEAMRQLGKKSAQVQGVGVGSRVPLGEIPTNCEVIGRSRGSSGQTMIEVVAPGGTYRSVREFLDAEHSNLSVGEEAEMDTSADSAVLDMSFEPTDMELRHAQESSCDEESDDGSGSDLEWDSDSDEEIIEDEITEEGYFIADNNCVSDFIGSINACSSCKTPNCDGIFIIN